jgi:large subunit ribosomal protein L4
MLRLALNSSFSDGAANHRIKVVSAWEFVAPKTKDALSFLDTLGLTGNVLVVLDPDDITTKLSFRNIPKIRLLALGELTSYNVLRSDWVVFSDLTLPGLCVVHSAKANQDGDDGAEKMAEAARTGDDK